MKISTNLNKEKNIRQHRIHGLVDVAELMGSLKELYNVPGFDPGMNVLWDLREVDVSLISSQEIQAISDDVLKMWGIDGKNKVALVVSGDLSFGLSRMFQMMIYGETSKKVNVFIDMAEAKEWIEE